MCALVTGVQTCALPICKFEGFDFIVGGFLSHDRSAGAMGSTFRAFAVGDVPGVPVTAHVENKNYAIYGQVGVNITEKLKLNLGGRYSWDKVNACGGDRKSTRLNSSN